MGESGRVKAHQNAVFAGRGLLLLTLLLLSAGGILAHAAPISDAERNAAPPAPVFSNRVDTEPTPQAIKPSQANEEDKRVEIVLPPSSTPPATPSPVRKEEKLIPVPKKPAVIIEPNPITPSPSLAPPRTSVPVPVLTLPKTNPSAERTPQPLPIQPEAPLALPTQAIKDNRLAQQSEVSRLNAPAAPKNPTARFFFAETGTKLGPSNRKRLREFLSPLTTDTANEANTAVHVYINRPFDTDGRLIALRQSGLRAYIKSAGIAANRIRFRISPFSNPANEAHQASTGSTSSPHFADIRIAETGP